MKHSHHQIFKLYNSLIHLTNQKLSLRSKYLLHRLRIATRKLESLIRLFKFAISKKLFCKVNKLLGKIRKKAGTIRNHQLFLKNIDKATFSDRKLKKSFTTHIQKNIRCSKAEFCDFAKKHKSKLLVLLKEVNLQIKTLQLRKCQKIKRSKIRGFKKRVEAAIRNKQIRFKEIHEMRITAKKLRYQLEILSEIHSNKNDQSAIKQLRKLQKVFGRITDQKLFIRHMVMLRQYYKKESDTSVKELDPLIRQAKQRFRKSKSSLGLKKII